MLSRRIVFLTSLFATAISFFTLGATYVRHAPSDASHGATGAVPTDGIRTEPPQVRVDATALPAGTAGRQAEAPVVAAEWPAALDVAARAKMVAEIKEELRSEMGLLPLQLLRDRRSSFVELYSYDNLGKTNYGTAGYLGNGYFITVKHAVVALRDDEERAIPRKVESVKIVYRGKEIPAKVVDTGNADVEVHSGDWAILRTRDLDLPALRVDTSFEYEFAEPIFRLGNDYSKGIIVSTGNVGQRTDNGLVTCLTDGHPGVSGGGVLDQRGDLVGIPVGRMQGDYRFSFILPLRAEMLRKVPAREQPAPAATLAAIPPPGS